jgi:hypothetical protein
LLDRQIALVAETNSVSFTAPAGLTGGDLLIAVILAPTGDSLTLADTNWTYEATLTLPNSVPNTVLFLSRSVAPAEARPYSVALSQTSLAQGALAAYHCTAPNAQLCALSIVDRSFGRDTTTPWDFAGAAANADDEAVFVFASSDCDGKGWSINTPYQVEIGAGSVGLFDTSVPAAVAPSAPAAIATCGQSSAWAAEALFLLRPIF